MAICTHHPTMKQSRTNGGRKKEDTRSNAIRQSSGISNHLFEALRALRYPDRARLLWVDRFCFNQDNTEIDLMFSIYSKATSVIIWLGKENPVTKTAFEVMDSLAYIICRERNGAGMKGDNISPFAMKERPSDCSLFLNGQDFFCFSFSRKGPKMYRLPRHGSLGDDAIFRFNDDRLWTEIDGILSNSYLERAWIVEEVAAAAEVNVFRGKSNMPWSVFWAAYLGRQIFAFKPHMASDPDASYGAI
ncbi:hypothetical protein VTN00DRAFT_7703 [Thermoascus crustaceus]|uniref:uncharacterized protein n=1 Tax=Thermoascus crustaceus TaxID=5088 RepID=UPI0037442933